VKRFRIFQKILEFSPEQCTNVIYSATILHNFLIFNKNVPDDFVDIPPPIDCYCDEAELNAFREKSGPGDLMSRFIRNNFADYFYNLRINAQS